MADYKELLRKAVEALPENSGAARRAVYEKARSALVTQLRGLNPPLPAREITQHRLQLEDCIRQVEQEASEQVIASLKHTEDLPQLAPPAQGVGTSHEHAPARGTRSSAPVALPARRAAPAPQIVARADQHPKPASRVIGRNKPAEHASIEDIIAAAEDEFPEEAPVEQATGRKGRDGNGEAPRAQPRGHRGHEDDDNKREGVVEADTDTVEAIPAAVSAEDPAERHDGKRESGVVEQMPRKGASRHDEIGPRLPARVLPSIVARAEAIKSGKGGATVPITHGRPGEKDRRGPVSSPPRREIAASAGRGQAVVARRAVDYAGPMSASAARLHEVEIADTSNDPQSAIDRAIATLDREARGESVPVEDNVVEMPAPATARQAQPEPEPDAQPAEAAEPQSRKPASAAEAGLARAPIDEERGGGSAITIFLVIFLVLLMGAGGGAYWAWHEGYIDFASMFGDAGKTAPAKTVTPAPASKPAESTAAPIANTTSTPTPAAPPKAELKSADRLDAAPAPEAPAQVRSAQVQPAAPAPSAEAQVTTPRANAPDSTEAKTEDRLSKAPEDAAGKSGALAANPAAAAGSQSLLLEASDDGTTGAVPFSGVVDWSQGKDELGQPTIVGKANIPARNLSVSVLIRKNSDPTLPASHLMEINFKVSDSFIGGSIAGLPGVLLKNEELVQGSPLIGASARVVGNSFLFALSSAPEDVKANTDLLTSRKWMDLAIIYATGKRAIITLEKDDKAQALFTTVFADWAKPPAG